MKLFVLERIDPAVHLEPTVFLSGYEALTTAQKEYKAKMAELNTSQEIADAGFGEYACDWLIDDNKYVGYAMISSDYDSDRWGWILTEHVLDLNKARRHAFEKKDKTKAKKKKNKFQTKKS